MATILCASQWCYSTLEMFHPAWETSSQGRTISHAVHVYIPQQYCCHCAQKACDKFASQRHCLISDSQCLITAIKGGLQLISSISGRISPLVHQTNNASASGKALGSHTSFLSAIKSQYIILGKLTSFEVSCTLSYHRDVIVNAVGEVPLKWYKDEDHIGYDRVGDKLIRKGKKDKLDALLDRNDNIKAWRTIYDEYNDEEITLSKEEVELIQRIRKGQFPHVEVNYFL